MIRDYESVFLISPELEEEARKGVIDKVKGILEKNNVTPKNIDEWGLRKTAYEINHHDKAYYVFMEFPAEGDFVKELERNYRIIAPIVRFITVQKAPPVKPRKKRTGPPKKTEENKYEGFKKDYNKRDNFKRGGRPDFSKPRPERSERVERVHEAAPVVEEPKKEEPAVEKVAAVETEA